MDSKILKLFTYVDGGVGDTPFPNTEEGQIEIGTFRFDAKRMGGAPTITASVNYPSCLDNEWTDMVYAEFRGEKYYLKQTPTSSYNNESSMYKHDIELVSERVILDNVYFYDAVKNASENNDAASNSTTFAFFGSIVDFANKLNSSLEYAELRTVVDGEVSGWNVVCDENITSEEKLISFDNAFFSNAIQESYNTFKIPYYFKGKEIHFGYTDNTIAEEFSYGVDDALLSITKTNANYKIVNRVTGTGSSDNIPYYYPNNSPKGNITIESSREGLGARIIDMEKFTTKVNENESVEYSVATTPSFAASMDGVAYESGDTLALRHLVGTASRTLKLSFTTEKASSFKLDLGCAISNVKNAYNENVLINPIATRFTVYQNLGGGNFKYFARSVTGHNGVKIYIDGARWVELYVSVEFATRSSEALSCDYAVSFNLTGEDSGSWIFNGEEVKLSDLGLASNEPKDGDTITQRLGDYINSSNVLLPPKYRDSKGVQRFYNATNDTYTDDNGEPIVFTNPFVEGHPKEHIITVEDIKPTIKEKRNASNLRIDMFSEFAYDDNDNDETYIDEEDGNTYFKHPYFYGKLRIMDFNLFDHAIENQPMTISFTSGAAGACNFEIGATEEYPQKNPVQVDANGNLLKDENGMVIAGVEKLQPEVTKFQDRQQDTSKYEVWIALKKEEATYGVLMPQTLLRPKACTSSTANDGDTFVILGINLPQSYIDAAEEKLEKEIIKYMYENNVEKFKFSIKFSRIYFEENPDILELLDENSRIYIWYNGTRYTLYVSSISYSMADGEVLPDITVELDDTLAITQNALQNAISQVKADVGNALGNIDITALGTPYFVRKDQDDEVQGKINFKRGIKFGEGGRVDLYDDNSAKLTIEYLEVTKKATFTSLEIQEKTHVGGQILISPAAMTCGEVEELENAYRCYFQTKGQDGNDEIFNQFVVGDQAICQTFNAWGSRYYWRLVVGVGEDYIDLSKTDCDEESDIPMAGDKIIQLGHRTDKTRQAAQVLSAHGETSPAFIMYNGINDYTLEGKEVTGILWNPATQEPQMYSYGNFFFGNRTKDENGEFVSDFITFQPNPENTEEKKLFINADVQFGGGSKGLSDLSEWQELQGEVNDAIDGVKKSVQEVQDQIDGVVENWNGFGTPTFGNEPAVNWITNAEKIAHINDTYINIEVYENDKDTPTAGQAWRWCQCGESEGEGTQTIIINGPLTQGEWVKVGQLDMSYNYNYVVSPNGKIELAYDQEIMILSGPPTYIKVDRSGAIYLLDNYSYFVGANSITLLFEYADYTIAYDKDGNLIKLHWHPIADSDAVRALKDAAEATRIAESAARSNLIADSSELIYTYAGSDTTVYGRKYLPITVNAREQYTFKCELAENLSDDGVNTFVIGLAGTNSGSGWISNYQTVEFGKNIVVTFTVNDGIQNVKADLCFYKSNAPRSAKARFSNFSLVKGTTPMLVWEDYQGDNGLVNLMNIYTDEVLTIGNSSASATTYNVRVAKFKVKAGERYIFRAENAKQTAGTTTGGYNIGIRNADNTAWLSTGANQYIAFGDSNWTTLTIANNIAEQEGYLQIYSGQAPNANQKTIELTRPTLVKGTRPMMVWKANTDYLTNAFKNGQTIISGGLVMTQAVMVEDGSGTVKGMLNGSTYGEDATHGRLIVAAGSEGASASQFAAATTKIYEDGTVDTKKIKADGGEIGVFKISENGFLTVDTTTVKGKMTLGETGLFVGNNTTSQMQYTTIGGCGGTCITATNNGSGVYCPIDIDTQKIAIMVASSNTAIMCTSGMFAGLRPKLRAIQSSATLTSDDHTIININSKPGASNAVILNLPTSPLAGQEYRICNKYNTHLYVTCSTKSIRDLWTGSIVGSYFVETANMIDVIWGGSEWLACKAH